MAIIGIDLGTSNSAAAVLRGGRPVIIPSAEGISIGGKAFPSYVAVMPDGQTLIGEPARRQAVANPDGTATAFKRSMGQREQIQLHDKSFSPEQLSAFLLQKIKNDAEAYLGEPVTQAVVTVPAYFDDNQRSATKDACRIAGLEVARLINEPTAASLAYGLDRAGEELRIAVIDFGGGTLDVTIMEFGKGVFEVKATSGDTRLGGTDMDHNLVEYIVDKFQQDTGVDVHSDAKAMARLKEAAEVAKIELSSSTTTHITLPYLTAVAGEPEHLDMDLTRTELERQVNDVVQRCRGPIEQALHDASITSKDIDRIVFVGGPTKGGDLEVRLVVPLEKINTGGDETVRFNRPVICPSCHGSGAKPGTAPRQCAACNGTGQQVTTRKESKEQGTISFQQITACPVCHGQGAFIDHPCENCNGSGEINQEDKLKVTIPAGVDEGAALRIPGHGLPSSDPSGPPGDF